MLRVVHPRKDELDQLAVHGEVDAVLEIVTLDEIAQAWVRSQAQSQVDRVFEDDPDWWAVDLVHASIDSDWGRDRFRALLLALVDSASSDHALGMIGAGPLESFVSDDEDDLAWFAAHCATKPKLRAALRGVWCASFVTPATLARLDAAAGGPLTRPLPREQWPPELRALEDAEERLDEVVGQPWWTLDRKLTSEEARAHKAYRAALDRYTRMHVTRSGDKRSR